MVSKLINDTLFLLASGGDKSTLKDGFIFSFFVMKKIISLVLMGLFFGYVVAYEPTSQDITQINSLKTQFDSITTGNMKDKWDFYAQIKTLQEQFSSHEQLNYYLDQL